MSNNFLQAAGRGSELAATDLIGPAVTAALVAAVISLVIALVNKSALLASGREKLDADRRALQLRISTDVDLAVQKLAAERDKTINDKAWADYELRRDAYIALASEISCLYEGGDSSRRSELHRIARRIRLVGSDEVVRTMNDFFASIRAGVAQDALEGGYRRLFNAMRRDIRQLHSLPPEGTDLSEDAFPIES